MNPGDGQDAPMDAAAPDPPSRPSRGLTAWRDKLPRVPDPIRVDVPGWSPRAAFTTWLVAALGLAALGIWLNWWLTGGTWALPEAAIQNELNPFGTTRTQFLTTHPYDVLTTSLFVASNLLLGLSLVRSDDNPRNLGYWAGLTTAIAGVLAMGIGGLVRTGTIGATIFPADGLIVTGLATAVIGTIAMLLSRAHRFMDARRANDLRYPIRVAGWTLFAFHWATTAINLYVIEDGDVVNMGFALASVFVLTYFAYHELISKRLGKDNTSLRFAAGAVFIASFVWYAFLRIEPLSQWIIEVVAGHTVAMLHAFGQEVAIREDGRTGFVSAIFYPGMVPPRTVIIILACTAIQSMMIFVAAALAVDGAAWSRRWKVIYVTVPIVYILNLLRNTIIVFMWETRWLELKLGIDSHQSFSIAHNWIGKVGSLVALVFIAMFVFTVLPEVVAAVVGLLDLPRRRGPLEQQWFALTGRSDQLPAELGSDARLAPQPVAMPDDGPDP